VPAGSHDRQVLLKAVAFDATLYGLSAYLQYGEMFRQAVNRGSGSYTGFNTLQHERQLAGPGYRAFKVPNSDTLYSTAWLDLTRGPLEVTIPPVKLKYYTLNLFDMFGNPDNLGTRTIGSNGGHFLLVPPGWHGDCPPGMALYRAATPHLWVLMRVFAQTDAELSQAHRFQDEVRIAVYTGQTASPPPTESHVPTPAAEPPAPTLTPTPTPPPEPPPPGPTAADFFRVLDYILRVDGHLPGEEALVHGLRALGLAGPHPFDPASVDADSWVAIEAGYKEAMALIANARTQLGKSTGTGWVRVDKGNYGFNYLRRAVTNSAGLGANVPAENSSFNTFVDDHGEPLNGTAGRYRLELQTPPPVDAFWSVTLYDARSFELYPNAIGRYLISDRTPGLRVAADGSIEVAIQHEPVKGVNWLPAPAGPFFVVIRSYLPRPAMLNGTWLPEPIRRLP
jgi:hypothetical protein